MTIYCGMCGDTGLQNGVKCPQYMCRKANGLPPYARPLTLSEMVDQAIATVYVYDMQREHTVFPAVHYA